MKELLKEAMQLIQMGIYPNLTIGQVNSILNRLKDEESKIPPKNGDKKGATK